MSVTLYLILAVLLLVVSATLLGAAAAEVAALRQRDHMMEFKDERQHALLGRCVEWAARVIASGWMLIGLGYSVVFCLPFIAGPFAAGWEQRPLPLPAMALGLGSATAIAVFSRAALRKSHLLIEQYDGILAGKTPDWADAEVRTGIGQAV